MSEEWKYTKSRVDFCHNYKARKELCNERRVENGRHYKIYYLFVLKTFCHNIKIYLKYSLGK